MVSLDLTSFGNVDICSKSDDMDKCREESRIWDNGKWINPTGASSTAEGACGAKKCTPDVQGVPMNVTNRRLLCQHSQRLPVDFRERAVPHRRLPCGQ